LLLLVLAACACTIYNHASYMHGHALLADIAHATSGKQVHFESVMQFLTSTGVIAGDDLMC